MIEVAHICLSPKSYVNIYRHSDYVVPYLKCFLFMSEAEVRPYPSEIAEKTCFAIICRHKTDITALMHRVLSLLSISRNLLTPPKRAAVSSGRLSHTERPVHGPVTVTVTAPWEPVPPAPRGLGTRTPARQGNGPRWGGGGRTGGEGGRG